MQDKRSPHVAHNSAPLVRRMPSGLMSLLSTHVYRLVGWCAVVGIPALVLGPRRMVRLTRQYPVSATAIGACLLCGAFLWHSGRRPATTEFEFEPIEQIDPSGEVLVDSGPVLLADRPLDAIVIASAPSDEHSLDRQSPGPAIIQPAAGGALRVIWLTGDIEEYPGAESVRSADRLPISRQ